MMFCVMMFFILFSFIEGFHQGAEVVMENCVAYKNDMNISLFGKDPLVMSSYFLTENHAGEAEHKAGNQNEPDDIFVGFLDDEVG